MFIEPFCHLSKSPFHELEKKAVGMRKKNPIGKNGRGHEEKNPVGKKGRRHESKKSRGHNINKYPCGLKIKKNLRG